jgi:hypothetical protein
MTAVRLLLGTLGSVCARTGFTWAPASSPAARDAGPISSTPAINDPATANFSLPNLIDEMVIVSASTTPAGSMVSITPLLRSAANDSLA